MTPAIVNNAARAAVLGVALDNDLDGNLVLRHASRSLTIRRLALYQVDDVRFLDADAALSAALDLFTPTG